eukprot:NODE_6344_length_1680_cov_9.092080.p1 GENE.NODE_6344_length_1680_cov_9.092080~~NODE_6344_length_1680_cov_9.092080.p1  ORF type:complete len:487 (+),score=114.69 NODE_6344_length_1680_cov_9.092080:215-1462(+)
MPVRLPEYDVQEIEVLVPITTITEEVVEVQSAEIVEMLSEVGVPEVREVEKPILCQVWEPLEKSVDVTHVEVIEQVIEVPVVSEVREVIREVPVIEVHERIIEVPEIEVREVIRHVPKVSVQYVDRTVVVPVLEPVERVIDVEAKLKHYEAKVVVRPLIVETTTRVPVPEWTECLKEVPHYTVVAKERFEEVLLTARRERLVEVPLGQVATLTSEVVQPTIAHQDMLVARSTPKPRHLPVEEPAQMQLRPAEPPRRTHCAASEDVPPPVEPWRIPFGAVLGHIAARGRASGCGGADREFSGVGDDHGHISNGGDGNVYLPLSALAQGSAEQCLPTGNDNLLEDFSLSVAVPDMPAGWSAKQESRSLPVANLDVLEEEEKEKIMSAAIAALELEEMWFDDLIGDNVVDLGNAPNLK